MSGWATRVDESQLNLVKMSLVIMVGSSEGHPRMKEQCEVLEWRDYLAMVETQGVEISIRRAW